LTPPAPLRYKPAMKARIKLAFCDFWPKFDPADNYFTRLLRQRFTVELSDHPQFVIFSTFGQSFRRFRCTRIFYTGENWRPDFWNCDYAFTFDHLDDARHFRLPVYGLFNDPGPLIKRDFDADRVLAAKTRFCNFVYSNPLCRTRNRFFHELSKYKPVDSGGRLFNNIGAPVADKLAFIKQSKFTIAFENDSQPGYTTEKLSEPMLADSVPIYWGNPLVERDFNPRSFISAHDWPGMAAVIDRVIEVDRHDDLYLELLRQPWLNGNRLNQYIDPENILAQFERIFSDPQTPVATRQQVARFFRIDQLSSARRSLLRRVIRSTKKFTHRFAER
jgi:alpha(1,3/1,4) fucosyltransferase